MLRITVMPEAGSGAGFDIGDNSLPRGAGCKLINLLQPDFDAAGVRTTRPFRGQAVRNIKQSGAQYLEATTFSPEIDYLFNSQDEKAAFLLALQSKVPPVATVKFTEGNTVWYLVNARLRPIRKVEELETSIKLQYTISGGVLTTSL